MSKLQKLRRCALREAQAIVAAAGGTCSLRKPNGCGHYKLAIELDGITRITPIAGTPTRDIDYALRMKMADVRRILREMGATA